MCIRDRDHGSVIHSNDWSTGMIEEVLGWIDAEDFEDRVMAVSYTHLTLRRAI